MTGAFHTQKWANVSNRIFYPPPLPTMPYFIYVSTDLRDLLNSWKDSSDRWKMGFYFGLFVFLSLSSVVLVKVFWFQETESQS